MGYIESLLRARLAALLLMGALAATTTGLAGKALRQLHNETVWVETLGKSTGFKDAKLHAGDVVAAVAIACTAAGVGFIVACYSEWQLHRERKHGFAPWGSRFLNEFLLGLSALFMLGSAIASTIIVLHRSAKVTGVPESLQLSIMKIYHKSVRYRDYFCYYAMILSWVTFASFLVVFVLVILAGLYYRKHGSGARVDAHDEKHSGTHVDA